MYLLEGGCGRGGIGVITLGDGQVGGNMDVESSGCDGSSGTSSGLLDGSIEEKSSGGRNGLWSLTLDNGCLCADVLSCCCDDCFGLSWLKMSASLARAMFYSVPKWRKGVAGLGL